MSGFHQGRKSIDSIIVLVTSVRPLAVRWRPSGRVLVDIKGTLDSITDKSIASALVEVRFDGRLSTWIKSYIQKRLNVMWRDCTLIKKWKTQLMKNFARSRD